MQSSPNKHCLIIGMGAGLSLAIATRFAAEGFVISAIARDASALRGFMANFRDSANYFGVAGNVAESASLQQAIAACERQNRHVCVLVYNVAQSILGDLSSLSASDLRQSLTVNVEAALTGAHCVLPAMLKRRAGTLLFTGGGLALQPESKLGALSIGKAAIRSLALTFAKELRPFHIHAATVTICGKIQAGTFFSPDKIAEVYWQLHEELPSEFRNEVIYREGGTA